MIVLFGDKRLLGQLLVIESRIRKRKNPRGERGPENAQRRYCDAYQAAAGTLA